MSEIDGLRHDRLLVLAQIGAGRVDIRKISEPFRQRAIDLAMQEPPLIDIDGGWLFITDAGRAALTARKRIGEEPRQ